MPSISDFLIDAVFGKQVSDNAEQRKNPTFNYRRRMNKFVALGGAFWWGAGLTTIWFSLQHDLKIGIVVAIGYLSLTLLVAIGAASDAIFDSLHERINLQSQWLNVRLSAIEDHLAISTDLRGETLWQAHSENRDTLDEAYHRWPERCL